MCQKSVELDHLVEIKIYSTECSINIQSIVITSTRMKQLFDNKSKCEVSNEIKEENENEL